MTIYKFNKLSFSQQLFVLDIHSVKIDSRKQDLYHISLFQLRSFYVEAYYLGADMEIERLYAFTGTSKLKPYLERIDIGPLLKEVIGWKILVTD